MSRFRLTDLPRGGTLVSTPSLTIQFGVPPETIKDTMTSEQGVPQVFVLTPDLFDFEQGITTAELEFPAYYHYFFKRQNMTVMGTESQVLRLNQMLNLTLFGPEQLHLEQDFLQKPEWLPDLRREMDYFRINTNTGKSMHVVDFVHFQTFDAHGKIQFQDLCIESLGKNRFRLTQEQEVIEFVVSFQLLKETEFIERNKTFEPPNFGVTVLGSGHGFAPDAKTSGFLLWIEKQGILVDPPVNAGKWMKKRGIDPIQIHSIFLTHCHADHDSGTLQICLQAWKIKLYTTPTIYEIFLQKACCLTGFSAQKLLDIVEFCPLFLDQPNSILGAEFVCQYTLHSIPTVCFTVSYRGQSFTYSADTLNDPEQIQKLYEQGIIDKPRYEQLLDFPWESSLIFHEAGVPPLHTPVKVLEKLPASIKKKTLLVHTGAPPAESGLILAQPGTAQTVRLEVENNPHQEAIDWLLALSRIEIFKTLSLSKAMEFLTHARKQTYEPESILIRKGEHGNDCYFILEGKAKVLDGEYVEKIYGIGTCFGETAILLDIPRTATIQAQTKLTVLALNREHFLSLIRGTNIPHILTTIYHNRQKQSWKVLEGNPLFSRLETAQKIQLQGFLEHFAFAHPYTFSEYESPFHYGYFIESGILEQVYESEKKQWTAGDFIFEKDASANPYRTQSSLVGFRAERAKMLSFLKQVPGLWLRLFLRK